MTGYDAILDPGSRPRLSRAATPPRRFVTASTSRSMPSAGAITATGWPSTTTCRPWPARRRRSSSRTSPAGHRPSESAPAASCCPNHSPLVIAEQFGTLESLFPGRIDLGVGRAPGERPGDGDGAAAQSQHRFVSTGCPGAHGALSRAGTGPARQGRSRRGIARAHLDSRIEPVRRASSRPSSACRSRSRRTSRRRR